MAVWNASNVEAYIPELWSTIVQAAAEANLVFGNHVDRRFERELTVGDTLYVPTMANFGAASQINADADITTYASDQSCVALIVNYHYQKSVQLGEQEQIQDSPDILIHALKKCGYSVSMFIDSTLAALVNSFTTYGEGTDSTALTADVLINAYEDLNEADAPEADRVWIFDPESITDLLKLDYFVRMDYVPDSVVSKGFLGRQIFGAPVYMTTNLYGTANHDATYMHREALALVSQQTPTIFRFPWAERFSQVVGVKTLFGVQLMRVTFGVLINTRS